MSHSPIISERPHCLFHCGPDDDDDDDDGGDDDDDDDDDHHHHDHHHHHCDNIYEFSMSTCNVTVIILTILIII